MGAIGEGIVMSLLKVLVGLAIGVLLAQSTAVAECPEDKLDSNRIDHREGSVPFSENNSYVKGTVEYVSRAEKVNKVLRKHIWCANSKVDEWTLSVEWGTTQNTTAYLDVSLPPRTSDSRSSTYSSSVLVDGRQFRFKRKKKDWQVHEVPTVFPKQLGSNVPFLIPVQAPSGSQQRSVQFMDSEGLLQLERVLADRQATIDALELHKSIEHSAEGTFHVPASADVAERWQTDPNYRYKAQDFIQIRVSVRSAIELDAVKDVRIQNSVESGPMISGSVGYDIAYAIKSLREFPINIAVQGESAFVKQVSSMKEPLRVFARSDAAPMKFPPFVAKQATERRGRLIIRDSVGNNLGSLQFYHFDPR